MPRQAIELQEVDSFGAWDLQHFAHDLGTSSAFLAQENSYIHIVFFNGLVKGCERENGRMLFHSVSHVFPIQIASNSLLHPNTHPNIPQHPKLPPSPNRLVLGLPLPTEAAHRGETFQLRQVQPLVAVGIQGVEEKTNGVTTVLALLGMGMAWSKKSNQLSFF